jgi:PAS domain S-box-containing protein
MAEVEEPGEIPCVLATVIKSSLNAIVLIDERAQILDYNAAAEKAFGYRAAEMIGRPIGSFIAHHPGRKAQEQALQRFIRGGHDTPGAMRTEVDAIASSGERIPVEATITGVDIAGRRRFICHLRDLSPEHHHDEELAESRRRLELAVDGAKLGTWTFDVKTGRTWYSDRSKKMYGLPLHEQMTTSVIKASVHPDDWEKVSDPYLYGFTEDRVGVEYRVICPDGTLRWIYSLGAVNRDAKGEPVSVNGIHLDITERKQGEVELAEARRQLDLAVEAAQLGSWTVEPKTGRTWYSDRSRDLWGVGKELQLDAAALKNHIHPEDWPKVVEPYLKGFPSDDICFELRVVWPNGETRWVQSIGTALRDANGEVTTVHGIHLDITERKQNEAELARSREALHQSEKLAALGSLLAGVSHELNNPLSAIVGQAQMLEEDAAGTPLEARAKKISAAADRCAKIVQTFLAMARRREPQRAPVDPNGLVTDALQLAEYGLRTAGILAAVECDPGLPPIQGDKDQLHQVLVNLIINAQQALEGSASLDKRLTVRATAADERTVAIDIVDNGPGIPEAVAGRIFEPFFTTKPQGSGTGVGLSFSQGIVEAHGGTLTILPTETGAAFRILLPAAEPVDIVVVGGATPEPEPIVSLRRKALVIDDEEDVAGTIGELLEREGFHVTIVSDGAQALRALDHEEFDIVLSDLRMPGVSGPEMYARLAEIRPQLLSRIAFVTGDTLGSSMDEFLRDTGRPVLEKPFTRTGVRCLVAALVEP